MPVKYKGILIIIFGIYTCCQLMKVKVICRKFECGKDIHYIRPLYVPVYISLQDFAMIYRNGQWIIL